ncbi:hypothetical protein BSKO_10662 [Bryopsis sp. KO-2023]|nr:hypothetical protein BSKO_10662 [Bryopsis sp. KO-2023]
MTTAHRPTWAPALGGEEQGGNRLFVPSRAYSAKDQPSHTKLKFRVEGQQSKSEVKDRDLLLELEEKEQKHFEEERKKDLFLLESVERTGTSSKGAQKLLVPKALDADDMDADDPDDSESEEDDSDDDEAELLAELERIKKERAEEAEKKAEEEAERELKEKEEQLLRGNPLVNRLDGGPSFSVKRRWDDDVVFKNQTRGEPKAKKRFINDTVRSDFHQRFLQRYIR